MTKVSKHELPGDFWSSDEMFEFVNGLVERQQRGEAVTQIVIEEALEKLMTRHEFKDQNILAIEDGMEPPTKRMKVATDEDIHNLVQIWETQPMRISLEDHIFPIDDYSQFSISRVRLDGECLGLMRCNHPLCCEKPLADRLHKVWFSSRTGQPHKYSVRRHHEQCHFGKSVSRATVIEAAALVISDTQLPLDSWAKPSLKHFISSVGQSSTFNKNTISVDEIVAALRKANRPLSEAHRAELIAAGKAALIYETDPNRAEVKSEPDDRASETEGIQIEEIEGGMDDSMGEDMPLSEILNQPPKPPSLTAPPSSITSGASGGLLAVPGGGGGASAPSSANPTVSDGLTKGAQSLSTGSAAPPLAKISCLEKPDDPSAVDSDDDDLHEKEEEMEADSDIPIESEIVKYPGECTDLFKIYERWSPILSKEAKEKLVLDFCLNEPLYQKPEDIEDPELRLTIRDEWITVFPHWLANFKPLNAKDDGFQRIPLSDILAMRRMYRTELQARRTAPAK
ncbi:unnamed protein product [Oikopleura dioica]|uniref:Uncharacterized protein n=2 Tax=Oikopleura dioica TaxID=34765 RepID=E4X4Q2_OIKDI|nr:unnamed protein product [Oikopleura dioica]